ncbi:MAG: AMP-binding protein, partial [Candidatus Methanomethylophilaceae archaeon]|nr:AMP-binding protein [Candidatus Methanomethylophilaceae archaeon]
MRNINLRYVDEKYEDGLLTEYRLKYPENFNFGYDIVDDIGINDPERKALIWESADGSSRTFTFREIMILSNKTANCLSSLGIGKGDVVMVILKQKFQFWYTMVALHKLGAIAVPATHMLTKHDVEYRVRSASVKAVICTDQSNVS